MTNATNDDQPPDALCPRCTRCGRAGLAWVPGPARICAECDGKVPRPGGRLQGMWPQVSLISGGKKVALPMKAGGKHI